MSNFAEKQLLKHGWKVGYGLGRDNDGIKQAIKVKYKFDTKGVGHDAGEEFKVNWWDHVFARAAQSITVKQSIDGVEIEQEESTGPITNKIGKTNAKKAMLYGNFLKGATLKNDDAGPKEISEVTPDSDQEEANTVQSSLPTDEEMFKICGGRTAHTAARHGHKMNGKLQRIQEQENLIADNMLQRNAQTGEADSSCVSEQMKNNLQMSDTNVCWSNHSKSNVQAEDTDNSVSGHTKKKTNRKRTTDETDILGRNPVESTCCYKKKKKHKKHSFDKVETCNVPQIGDDRKSKKKKKKRTKDNDCLEHRSEERKKGVKFDEIVEVKYYKCKNNMQKLVR